MSRKSIIGKEYVNNKGLKFIVLELVDKKKYYKVKFLDSGYKTIVNHKEMSIGTVKDKYYKNICDVACVGDVIATDYLKEYTKWNHMIQRCYNPTNKAYKNYGLKGVAVCERWLCFEYFLEDIPLIEGYDKEKFYLGELELDKDIKQLYKVSKIYSLETCMFLSKTKNVEISNLQQQKEFEGVSPEGKIYISNNITKFCEEHNLYRHGVSKCLRDLQKTIKGWKFRYK